MVIRRLIAPSLDFSALRRELKLPTQFSPAAQREADDVAASGPTMPSADHTDIAFVTLDPPTSMDLDQAMFLQRRSHGYRVWYAIADVSAFVAPGGALVGDTWQRGQTVYLPDGRVPLHPAVLSEGVASLLPGQSRPAVVWTIDLDHDGITTAVRVERAVVRSRAKLGYPAVQADVAAGSLAEPIALLPEIGALLIERGLARGAINLPMPSQEVEPVDGGWELVLRAAEPIEEYNAQISLLTGMAAADIMIEGKVGLLRTMPAPTPEAIAKLKAAAGSLGVGWPDGDSAGRVIGAVDGSDPRGAAFLGQAAELMRGAGYVALDGSIPDLHEHGGVAAPYAHVTAPLRRLADRYATEACLALVAGRELPEWVRAALPKLPDVMAATDRVANTAERGAVDLAEAVLLAGRVGERFDAAVLDVDGSNHAPEHAHGAEPAKPPKRPRGTVALDAPAVRARCEGPGLVAGERLPVWLAVADPVERRVLFETFAPVAEPVV
jgi:exoribonuclease R